MAEGQRGEEVVQAWNEHRPYLVDLAFRMLGDIGAAEDVVQDAFSRLLRTGPGEIADERGWLIVVTSRLCLDQIRSARARREHPHDASEIEFVPAFGPGGLPGPAGPGPESGDPADRVTLDDSVRLALLVVMQRLSPAERVVFVLHDIFQVPFGSIAQTVGRTEADCRQLARRARQKIADNQGGAAFEVGVSEHRRVTEKFIAACARGPGRTAPCARARRLGRVRRRPGPQVQRGDPWCARVARNLLHFWGPRRDPGDRAGGRAARAARVHRPGAGRRPGPDRARREGPGRARHRRSASARLRPLPARLSRAFPSRAS
jgi:RNA polymerase sigma-70 factor, ECF subfamily